MCIQIPVQGTTVRGCVTKLDSGNLNPFNRIGDGLWILVEKIPI